MLALVLLPLLCYACLANVESPNTNDDKLKVILTSTDTVGQAECETSPCLNGGLCLVTEDGQECVCSPGWSGDNCEEGKLDCTWGGVKSEGVPRFGLDEGVPLKPQNPYPYLRVILGNEKGYPLLRIFLEK